MASLNTTKAIITLFMLSCLLIICTSHSHQIIFLVDNSQSINEQQCIEQQQGISNYFKAFHDNPGNVLSYVSFI